VLTQPAFLAVHAASDATSPVRRGKVVRERLLCQPLPPPPPGALAGQVVNDPGLPARRLFELHARDPRCAQCHSLMDPIGFAFEGYDAVGRFRQMDAGRPVDASGMIVGLQGGDVAVEGAIDLSQRLAGSDDVQRCLAVQLFRYAMGRLEAPEDQPALDDVVGAFRTRGLDVRELMVALTQTAAFRTRPWAPEETDP
jgi:hypothetical protein